MILDELVNSTIERYKDKKDNLDYIKNLALNRKQKMVSRNARKVRWKILHR